MKYILHLCLILLFNFNTEAQNTWTQKADCGAFFNGAVGLNINGKGYVGLASNKQLWQYDPVTNAWSQKANFPGKFRTGYGTGFTIAGKGYLGTGYIY